MHVTCSCSRLVLCTEVWLYQRELLWEKKAKGFDFDEFHSNSQILMVGVYIYVAVQHVLRARTGTNGAETSILGPGMAGGMDPKYDRIPRPFQGQSRIKV